MLTLELSYLLYWKFPMLHLTLSSNPDRLHNTQTRVLQADWLALENDEKATLDIDMPYY